MRKKFLFYTNLFLFLNFMYHRAIYPRYWWRAKILVILFIYIYILVNKSFDFFYWMAKVKRRTWQVPSPTLIYPTLIQSKSWTLYYYNFSPTRHYFYYMIFFLLLKVFMRCYFIFPNINSFKGWKNQLCEKLNITRGK